MNLSPLERAAESFAAELGRRRVARGMTKKQLALQMGFDPSYVSHVEGRRHRPTEDFARRAEAVLSASGAIWRRFQEYDQLRHARSVLAEREPPVPEQWMPPGTGLIVEQELAALTYRDGRYHCLIRRALYNAGTEPVSRYLVRVAVDRYPHDPEASNRHHRAHPLTFDELSLRAYCDDRIHREPMAWRRKLDRDAAKELWLLFENAQGRFPLYPRQRVTIEYSYTVGEEKWGPWFQRAVRLPTRRLTVRLDLPLGLAPQVWGVETSLSAEEGPLRTPIARREADGRALFEWSTDEPPLNARYCLQWRFRGDRTHWRPAESAPSRGERPATDGAGPQPGHPPQPSVSQPSPVAAGAAAWSPDGASRPDGGGSTAAGSAAAPGDGGGSTAAGPAAAPSPHAAGPAAAPSAVLTAPRPVAPHGAIPHQYGGSEHGELATAAGVAASGGAARVDARPSARMRAAGIVQRGADILRQPARQFDLPRDAATAQETVARLRATLDRLTELHPFNKGVGLAAPQIGLPWATAVVRPPDRDAEPLVLLNPRVVAAAMEVDEQYEGCLSFFDVRGLVCRPLGLDVEHARLDGSRVITSFTLAMARLVGHEIDHLEGRLYVDRMAPAVPLVPVEEYGHSGSPWRY